jgi:hypothetical protein
MKIRTATRADLSFIAAANAALATETEGQSLDHGLLQPGVRAVLDDPTLRRYYRNDRAQEVYSRMGMHRSNYGVMETAYRGPESREMAQPC